MVLQHYIGKHEMAMSNFAHSKENEFQWPFLSANRQASNL
jgi:hypothetical protein